MTLPDERYRAVKFARDFMYELMDPKKTPGVPKSVRDHARHVLAGYGSHTGYAERAAVDPSMKPWSADWIITKTGHRALSVPMLGLEEGKPSRGDDFEHDYRAKTFASNYLPQIHI